MESSALLANVALIIAKDLNDEPMKIKPSFKLFEDESDDDEAWEFFLKQRLNRKRKLSPENKIKPKKRFINLLNRFDINEFENVLHMSKMCFLKIFQSVRNLLPKKQFPSVPPQTAFSLAVWKLATDEHFEQIARKFDIPFFDCQSSIRQFWQLIADNCRHFIHLPATNSHLQQVAENFQTHLKIPQLYGIIGLKRLDIFLESHDEEVEVIWQIICNADNKIIDCHVELAQDYTFDLSPIGKKLASDQDILPVGGFLIGDENFPLKPYLLRQFALPKSTEEETFNNGLLPCYAIIQNVFNTAAKRFNALYALESKDLAEVRKIVSTICCLHNICIDIEDDYVEAKKINWSKPINIEALKNSEDDEAGIKRRNELLTAIVK